MSFIGTWTFLCQHDTHQAILLLFYSMHKYLLRVYWLPGTGLGARVTLVTYAGVSLLWGRSQSGGGGGGGMIINDLRKSVPENYSCNLVQLVLNE